MNTLKKKIVFLLLFACVIFVPLPLQAGTVINIAILPLRLHAPENMNYIRGAFKDMLASRVGANTDIHIIEETKVRDIIAGYGAEYSSRKIIPLLAKRLGADYLVSPSLSFFGDNFSLDATFYDVAGKRFSPVILKGKGVDNILTGIDKLAGRVPDFIAGGNMAHAGDYTGEFSSVEYHAHAGQPAKKAVNKGQNDFIVKSRDNASVGMWKSRRLPLIFKGIEIADLDHDGKNEIVVIDDFNLFIYDLRGGRLSLRKEIMGPSDSELFLISAGDFNGNGLPEIYVSALMENSVSSFVVEFKDGAFKKIAEDIPYFIRVLKRGKEGSLLIGKRFRESDGFFGGIARLEWSRSNVIQKDTVDLPSSIGISGFSMVDVDGDGRDDIVSFDNGDHLVLYRNGGDNKWVKTWKSSDYYGGSLNEIEYSGSGIESDDSKLINLKGPVLSRRVDNRTEIIVSQNEPGGLGRVLQHISSYKSGKMLGLTWERLGLYERWHTKKLSGYIADYTTGDINNDGEDDMILLVVDLPGTFFSKGSSYLVSSPLGH